MAIAKKAKSNQTEIDRHRGENESLGEDREVRAEEKAVDNLDAFDGSTICRSAICCEDYH